MEQSESIAKLAEALSKAQAVIENAKKDSANPFYKSKYADLSSIWDACRKPLTDNGLSIVQSPVFMTEHPEMVGLDTRLCHSSGEWLEGRIVMKPTKSDPQSYGSCLSYLRRYSLQSFISICAESDDDGNAASGKMELKAHSVTPAKITAPAPTSAEKADVPDFSPTETPDIHLISEAQQKRLFAISSAAGWKPLDVKEFLQERFGITHSKEIDREKYKGICEYIEANKKS